ncbi:hypothetical protein KC571_00195, partial [candidate division WWE3 bacterium]|nr:hypothetical protein [candidate division WWE3 bacterium]
YYHTIEARYKEMAKNYQSQNEAKAGKSNRIIEHKGIKYNKGKGKISYKDGPSHDASPEIREMKFFLKLWSCKGEAVPYKDIAGACQTEFYLSEIADGVGHDQLENKDFAEHAKYLKRDFKKFILNLGMDDDNFRRLIKNVRNVGYYLTD